MAVLKLGLDKIDIGNNVSYLLPMILTYSTNGIEDDVVYLKIHPNKNLLEMLPDGDDYFELWIERGGRRPHVFNGCGYGSVYRRNNHYPSHINKSGGFRVRTHVCNFTKFEMQTYIANDSIPEIIIHKSDYDWGNWVSRYDSGTHFYIRASVRKRNNHTPHAVTGINSNKVKINYQI